jgi:hypothetical protein
MEHAGGDDGVLGPISRLEASAIEPRPRSTVGSQQARDGIGNRRSMLSLPTAGKQKTAIPVDAYPKLLEAGFVVGLSGSVEVLAYFLFMAVRTQGHEGYSPTEIDLP